MRYQRVALCGMHYQRIRNGVPLDATPKGSALYGYPICSVGDCDRRTVGRGLCGAHYQRAANGTSMDAPVRGPQRFGCVVEGCKRKHNSHGYCAMHGLRLERFGDVHRTGAWVKSETGVCSVEGCGRGHVAKGLCAMHYTRSTKGELHLPETLTCAWCGGEFPRRPNSDPRAVRFCSHECRYADQLEAHRNDPERSAKHRAWREKNPHLVRAGALKRAALEWGAERREVTGEDLRRMLVRYGGLCAYCKTSPHEHWDHVVPLARGGRHAVGNLAPSCAPCNLAKGAKLVTEWRFLKPLPKRFRKGRRKLAA